MVATSLQRLAAVMGMLLLLTAASAQTPALESPIDLKMRKADERLNVPVSLSSSRLYLSELLRALSLQTNVAIYIDENDSFSGVQITCNFDRVPLADVMNALWSAVGFKDATWDWKFDTQQGTRRYRFQPTQAARNLPDRLNREMQEALEAQAELMIRMARMSPAERQTNVDKLAASMLLDDPKIARGYVDPPGNLDRFWAAIRLFANTVPPEQRTRVLRGETVDVPLSSLADNDRQLAMELGGKNTVIVTDGVRREIIPDTIRFKSSRRSGDRKEISSHTFISVGGREAGFQGMSYFGMLEFGLIAHAYADWVLPGDLRLLDVETHPLSQLTQFRPDDIWQFAPALDRNVAQLAATEGVSFLAVVPKNSDILLEVTTGKIPSELWRDQRHLMHKWREGILLMNYPTWFYGDDAQYSYGTVKRLRARLHTQDGLLSLDDIVEPATTLNEAQLKRLSEEFSVFQGIKLMLPVCAFYKRYPRSQNEQGVLVDLKMQTFLQGLNLWPTALEEKEMITAARILDVRKASTNDLRHTYHLQLATSKHTWRDVASFWIIRDAPK